MTSNSHPDIASSSTTASRGTTLAGPTLPSAAPPVPAHSDPAAAWTAERIRALGVVTDLPTAARIFGLGRALAYQLARDDTFPVPVLRVGNRYRVAVGASLAALHLPAAPAPPEPAPEPPETGSTGTGPGFAGEPVQAIATGAADDLHASAQSSVDHHDEIRSCGPQRSRAAPTQGAP